MDESAVSHHPRKMIKLRSLALAASFAFSSSAPAADDKLAILLIDGQNNHSWQTTTPVLKEALEKSGKFTVTVSTSPPGNAPASAWETWHPDFAKYKAVVSNYNGAEWPPTVKKAFEDYVSGGGGFVSVHAADNSFPAWLEFNKMIGLGGWGGRSEKDGPFVHVLDGKIIRDTSPGAGGGHGAQHEFVVELTDDGKANPITKGMPEAWKHAKDELYHQLRGPAENMTILAYAFSPETKRNEPMVMTINYAKGRVFHTPMGHADYSMKDVGFWTVLQRGTEWAATGTVTIPVPSQMPTKDAVLTTP